jgi:hypothetical protein
MSKYETLGGYVTKSEAFSKFMHHIREAQDQALVISHLLRTEDTKKDELLATGWRGIAELMDRIHAQVLKLGQGKMQ